MSDAEIVSVQAGATLLGELARLAYAIADQAVVVDIRSYGVATAVDGSAAQWFDIRPLLDSRERSTADTDMFAGALTYARWRGLVLVHPQHAHLVRIVRQP